MNFNANDQDLRATAIKNYIAPRDCMENICPLDEIGIIHGELNNYNLLITLWTFYAGWYSPLCIYYEELPGKTCLFILGL